MNKKFLMGTVALAGLACGPADAVTIRDDVATAAGGMAAYYDRANIYPNVASLRVAIGQGQYCSGSLINARTVLTAAHCFVDDNGEQTGTGEPRGPLNLADVRGPGSEISFDPAADAATAGTAFSSVLPHAGYTGATPTNDVALVALSQPVTGLTPVQLASVLPATGQIVIAVGYGASVLASLGYDPDDEEVHPDIIDDARRRVAWNTLDFVGEAAALFSDYGGVGVVLGTDIDIPQGEIDRLIPGTPVSAFSSLGSAVALALEGGLESGDSGGPMFLVQADGSLLQVAVATAINTPDHGQALFNGTPLAIGYGAQNIWIGVPAFLDWIQANSFLHTASALAGDGNWSIASHWSGGSVPDNSSGYVNGGAARYYDVSLDQAGTTTLDMDVTVDTVTVNGGAAALEIGSAYTLTAQVGTTLAAGTVSLSGSLASAWLRVTGGTLSGSGTVTAPQGVTQSGGTVSPGGAGAIGTLNVAGAFSQTGGTLYAELSAGAADRLAASGAVSLAGGLQVALLGATPPADGSVFTVASGSSLDAAVLAAPDGVGVVTFNLSSTGSALQVTVGRAALTGFADSGAGRSVGAALDGMRGQPAFAGLFDSLDVLPSFQMARALDQLGGVSTNAGATSRAASAQFLGAASQRMAGVRAGGGSLGAGNAASLRALLSSEPEAAALLAAEQAPAGEELARPRLSGPTDGQGSTLAEAPVFALGRDSGLGAASAEFPWGVWAQPYGVRTARRGDSAGDRWDTTIGGVSGGIDYRLRGDGVRDGLLLGLSFGYATSDTGYRELTDETKSRAYQAGLYGGWWQGPWSVDAGLGFALNRYESRRDLNFGTTNASAEGRYDGREYSAYAEGRYRHQMAVGGPGVLELLPLAGVQALRLRTDSYTETGAGAMNLNVASDTVSSLRTSLGAAIAYPMAFADGRSLRPELRARWSHEFGDTDTVVDASFAAAGGAAFQVASGDLGRDAALLGAGLEARLSPRLSLAAAYDLQWQQGYSAQAVTGRVRLAF